MIYVEFMKNFLLADSSELMVVSLISASWAQKRLIPTFWTWCTSSWWKIFFSPIRANFWLLDSFRPPEPKKVWFLPFWHDVRRVHEKFSSRRFEANFWSELIAVRLISASWAQKRLIATFLTWCTSSSWKIFFSLIRANFWLLDSFRPPEPKNVWFLPFLTWCTSSSWKIADSNGCWTHFDSSDFLDWCSSHDLDSFRPPEPKNVWFLLL